MIAGLERAKHAQWSTVGKKIYAAKESVEILRTYVRAYVHLPSICV